MDSADVVIIGGGVVGTAVARAFSRYSLDVVLLEREADLAWATTRANSGIVHSGYHCHPGSLKARYCVAGNQMMPTVAAELGVPFKLNGSLTVAFTPEEADVLKTWFEHGQQNGVSGLELIDGATAQRREPALPDGVVLGLNAPTAGIISPYELALAQAENAQANGVAIRVLSPALKLTRLPGGRLEVTTPAGAWSARVVVNAAGLGSADLAHQVGDETIQLKPRRGEEYLLDRSYGSLVSRTIFPTAAGYSKGILVIPTVEGNLMLGPTDVPGAAAGELFTSAEGYEEIMQAVRRLIPGVPGPSGVIASFAGLRASSASGDFLIGPSAACPGLINVAGIDSPGLTAAPALAEAVVRFAAETGLALAEKPGYAPLRPAPLQFRELDDARRAELAAADPAWRRIVCRCEMVTEAEIVDAIRRGARSLDGIKLRTRAGMGRCQGGFCTPRVLAILARELGLPYTALTKRGPGSELVVADLAQRGGETGVECPAV